MSYSLKVLRDAPIGFWPLSEVSGTVASDISGCQNTGTFVGSPIRGILPLVSGGGTGTKIGNTSSINLPTIKNYYGISTLNGLATSYTSDNDFSLEVWISQNITTSNETPLLADSSNSIGLFWNNGAITFRVSSSESVFYYPPKSTKALHLVGVYSVGSISLYVDGVPVVSSTVTKGFRFTNSFLSLSAGPTTNSSDSFIIDSPAVYRYSLQPAAVNRHYQDGLVSSPAIQVVYPNKGTLFSCTDARIKTSFQYSYPENRKWTELLDSTVYFNQEEGFISFPKTDTSAPASFVWNDHFTIPNGIGLLSSKIEWRGDKGISVESSLDGITYASCVNGSSLPQYSKTTFNTVGHVYLRITMTSSDTSKFLPRLSYFKIRFFSDKDFYADNFGDYITSTNEYDLGSYNFPVLSREYSNGIRPKADTGFNLVTGSAIRSVEMFFTPISLLPNTLFYSPVSGSYALTEYSWDSLGAIAKTNISAVYVNGVDKTLETNISNFLIAGEPAHIVLVFTAASSGTLQFNYKVSAGKNNLYNNISVYTKALSGSDVISNYGAYTSRSAVSIIEPIIIMTENQVKYYDNDWIVIQSQ